MPTTRRSTARILQQTCSKHVQTRILFDTVSALYFELLSDVTHRDIAFEEFNSKLHFNFVA